MINKEYNVENIKKGEFMFVKEVGEIYFCDICGNEVSVIKAGGGELICCGEPMKKIG